MHEMGPFLSSTEEGINKFSSLLQVNPNEVELGHKDVTSRTTRASSSSHINTQNGLEDKATYGKKQKQNQLAKNQTNRQVASQTNFSFLNSGVEHALTSAGEVGEGSGTLDNNLESDTSQLDSEFKEPVAVEVQLSKGILDPEKHSAMTFKTNLVIFDSLKGHKNQKFRGGLGITCGGKKS